LNPFLPIYQVRGSDFMAESFFSVSFELIPIDRGLPYDLFINSSIIESREKFVRIVRLGDVLSKEDLVRFKTKYHQIYVREVQRSIFLKSLVDLTDDATPEEQPEKGTGENGGEQNKRTPGQAPLKQVSALDIKKTTVLKDSAIHHLETLFDQDPPTEVLSQTIVGCRDVVESMIDVLQDYNIDKLRELIGSLSFHDFYTYDHSINVSMYCILIYRSLNPEASKEEIIQAGMAGLLHDLGKIKIPTEIINNAGKLSDQDFKEIQKHPGFGQDLLLQSDLNLPADLDPALLARAIHEHHENFDGTGYPNKIGGENIHLLARITAIADFFDAITTKRSYHEPLSLEEAIALMKKFEGKKIDPELFHLFLQHAEQLAAKARTNLEFTSEDFDPCQPHRELPLAIARQAAAAKEASSDGKVKAEFPAPQPDDFGQVKVIEPKTAIPQKATFGKVKVLDNGPAKPFKKKAA